MDISHLDGHSLDPQAPVLARLMADLPELFSEGKLDSQKLKAVLGEEAFAGQERYGLTWNGKSECFKKIQETTTKTLRPCRQESVGFDTTQNLFIEGDNLQVLKVLQRSYYGKVKMVYIDPPYNTGNDFIYSDRFTRTRKEELIANGSMDAEGNIINHDLYRQNTRDSGHFHSNWLNMMYPRLFVAKSLLRPDGVIFVSIDDNEVKNLRAMMDEVFGEENFRNILTVRRYDKNLNKQFIESGLKTYNIGFEYILCYSKSDFFFFNPVYKESAEDRQSFGYWKGFWNDANRPTMRYGILGFKPETGQWKWKQETALEAVENYEFYLKEHSKSKTLEEYWSETGKKLKFIRRNPNGQGKNKGVENWIAPADGSLRNTNWTDLFASKHEKETQGVFDFPKNKDVISLLTRSSCDDNDIILDFFAGSGTTADAVMQLNAEDDGNRRWICVQLPEKCKPECEAAKAGFVTIADIAKERIRRAGNKIKAKNSDKPLDTGFKVFKLDESNFKVWDTQVGEVAELEQQLLDFVDNVRPGAQSEDLLYELILKTGLELNVAIEAKESAGGRYHRIGEGALIICLADVLTEPLLAAMLQDKPEKIIVLDRAFANNDQLKTNMLLQAEHAGVKEFTVI